MKPILAFGPFRLDPEAEILFRGTDPLALGRRAVAVLQVLVERPGAPVSKDALIDAAWPGLAVEDSNLTVQIAALRRELGSEPGGERWIETLPRRGYRFVGPAATTEENSHAGVRPIEAASPLPDKPSIAVLPFQNMSGDPEQEYFADGMVEEITTALARSPSLLVIARNSSFTYKGKTTDVRQIRNDLGVRYVLEGSVRRSADRLRFTGQLVDAVSGLHIWADRFDGDMSDVFALQDKFSASVVATIVPQLQLAEIERRARKPVENLNAYDLQLRALERHYKFSKESNEAALHYLKRALILDSSYAGALALAAHCYSERRFVGWAEAIPAEQAEGLRLAARAVELARDDSDVLWMAAWTYWILAQDAAIARELAARSIGLNANCAAALALAGWIEVTADRSEKAFELIGQAHRLNPRDPRDWFAPDGHGCGLSGGLPLRGGSRVGSPLIGSKPAIQLDDAHPVVKPRDVRSNGRSRGPVAPRLTR